MNYKAYTLWVFCVVAWNFGAPSASPLWDVIIAIALSFISIFLNSIILNEKK